MLPNDCPSNVSSSLQSQSTSGQTTASDLTQSSLLFTDTRDSSKSNTSTFPSVNDTLVNQASALPSTLATPVESDRANIPTPLPLQVSAPSFQPVHIFSSPALAPSAVLQANAKGGKPKWTDPERKAIIDEWFLHDINFQMIVSTLLRQSTERFVVEKPVPEELLADRLKTDTLADKYKKVTTLLTFRTT
jgi:hypothetical protein